MPEAGNGLFRQRQPPEHGSRTGLDFSYFFRIIGLDFLINYQIIGLDFLRHVFNPIN